MTKEQLKDYKEKLKLYQKLVELWIEVYGEDAISGIKPPQPPNPPETEQVSTLKIKQ